MRRLLINAMTVLAVVCLFAPGGYAFAATGQSSAKHKKSKHHAKKHKRKHHKHHKHAIGSLPSTPAPGPVAPAPAPPAPAPPAPPAPAAFPQPGHFTGTVSGSATTIAFDVPAAGGEMDNWTASGAAGTCFTGFMSLTVVVPQTPVAANGTFDTSYAPVMGSSTTIHLTGSFTGPSSVTGHLTESGGCDVNFDWSATHS